MSGDHRDDRGRPDLDRDGVPLPTEPPGELAEVFPLHPPTGNGDLGPPGPGHGWLVVEDLAAVLARVQAAGPPAWLIKACGHATPTASSPPRTRPARPGPSWT